MRHLIYPAAAIALVLAGCCHCKTGPDTEPWSRIPPPAYQDNPTGQVHATTLPADEPYASQKVLIGDHVFRITPDETKMAQAHVTPAAFRSVIDKMQGSPAGTNTNTIQVPTESGGSVPLPSIATFEDMGPPPPK